MFTPKELASGLVVTIAIAALFIGFIGLPAITISPAPTVAAAQINQINSKLIEWAHTYPRNWPGQYNALWDDEKAVVKAYFDEVYTRATQQEDKMASAIAVGLLENECYDDDTPLRIGARITQKGKLASEFAQALQRIKSGDNTFTLSQEGEITILTREAKIPIGSQALIHHEIIARIPTIILVHAIEKSTP